MMPQRDPRALRAACAQPTDLAAWNRSLNRTHAMARLRTEGGSVVRAIEARRRAGVATRVLRGRHDDVIDVGSEDGWMVEAWAPRVRRITMVDVDPLSLERVPFADDARVRRVVADVTNEDQLREGLGGVLADVIVLSAILEHVPQPGRVLDALRPYLKADGRFVIFVPADGPILAIKRILRHGRLGGLVRGLSLEPAPGHLHVFGRQNLRRLLTPRGRIEELVFDPAVLGWHAVLRPHADVGAR
jgi:SAM-dependent methyltransferase